MLQPVSERASQRALRSATNNDMAVPRCQLKLGEHAFSIAAPRAWNNIPADLHATLNTATFKKNLKTFLFRESYSTSWFNSFNLCSASLSIFIFGVLYFFVIVLVGLCCKPQPFVIIIIIIISTKGYLVPFKVTVHTVLHCESQLLDPYFKRQRCVQDVRLKLLVLQFFGAF